MLVITKEEQVEEKVRERNLRVLAFLVGGELQKLGSPYSVPQSINLMNNYRSSSEHSIFVFCSNF